MIASLKPSFDWNSETKNASWIPAYTFSKSTWPRWTFLCTLGFLHAHFGNLLGTAGFYRATLEIIQAKINLGKSLVYSAIARLTTSRHHSHAVLFVLTNICCIQEVKIDVVRIKIFACKVQERLLSTLLDGSTDVQSGGKII